jgi:hypothetical protein
MKAMAQPINAGEQKMANQKTSSIAPRIILYTFVYIIPDVPTNQPNHDRKPFLIGRERE